MLIRRQLIAAHRVGRHTIVDPPRENERFGGVIKPLLANSTGAPDVVVVLLDGVGCQR